MRAKCHFEDIDRGQRQAIIVDESPTQVNKKNAARAHRRAGARKRRSKASAHIQTERQVRHARGDRAKRRRSPGVVLNNLYSRRTAEPSASTWWLDHGQPLCNLHQVIEIFLEHRREVVTRRTVFELRSA